MDPESQTGVYAITNTVNGKHYVGSAARSFRERWNEHRHYLRNGTHHNRHLQSSWIKHGEAAFAFIVLERCEPEWCVQREQWFIDEMQAADTGFGYNISPTAGSTLGLKVSVEVRAHNSARQKGKKLPEWLRLKIKAAMNSAEVKAKIAATKTIRPQVCSDETRAKMSVARKGVRFTPEHRAKLATASAAHHSRLSPQQKKELGRKISEGRRLKKCHE